VAIPASVVKFLEERGARYDVVSHPRSVNSIDTADSADIPGDLIVKAVVLEDEDGIVLAVLPSTRAVHIGHLAKALDRPLRLADEADLPAIFPDCSPGAIPPLGQAYGVRTILDESVQARQEVFFEAGDHEHLIHMTGAQFASLIGPAPRTSFSQDVRHHPPASGSGRPAR
jgi:Ala-tRNA(Pro) deacylase